MKIRHLIAIVPAAVLVLAGCSGSNEDTAEAELRDSAVAEMCRQVVTFIDMSEDQAEVTGEPFDRQATGDEFMGLLKDNSALWVAAYNQQAESEGKEQLDPEIAGWEDLPSESRDLIEKAVQNGVNGTC
ncbi:hypothetical protein [Rhodococcus spongiicola]|uniref:Lipoprotein n=1 Tax=Rhodococcus spongiicola TaxID=2487352 RepID=A0A438AT14_9NOCA|nr:hypothetical protein [Rhodococcus spongiicola]RVW01836.1 hypothetical protein EF834_14780 [Rhodococcus spongiicola]